jgi:hypothetical protein
MKMKITLKAAHYGVRRVADQPETPVQILASDREQDLVVSLSMSSAEAAELGHELLTFAARK